MILKFLWLFLNVITDEKDDQKESEAKKSISLEYFIPSTTECVPQLDILSYI